MSEGRGCGCAGGHGHVAFEQGLVLSEPGQEQTPWGWWDVPEPPGSFLAACTHPSVPTVPKEVGDPHQEHLRAQSPLPTTTQVLLQLAEIPVPLCGRNFFAMPSEQRLPTSLAHPSSGCCAGASPRHPGWPCHGTAWPAGSPGCRQFVFIPSPRVTMVQSSDAPACPRINHDQEQAGWPLGSGATAPAK